MASGGYSTSNVARPNIPNSGPRQVSTDPEHYDNLVRKLLGEHGWQDTDLTALAASIKRCRDASLHKGTIRSAAASMNRRFASLAFYREIYGRIPEFSDDDKWMRRMGAAIERHQQSARQIDAEAATLDSRLREQEEADFQRALAASRSNHLDSHYADSAEGVRKFRENMAALGIDIVPNEGGRHSNSCLIVSMIQQATGGTDSPAAMPPAEVISQALAIKTKMAEASEGKVTVEGLVDPASTTKHMAWLRNEIARKYNILIDPHIVQANHEGNPVLDEPHEPLPGHVPVLIFNQGAHFEAMQFTASTGDFVQRHREAFEMIKTMSDSAYAR